MNAAITILIACFVIISIAGCGGSSPRFAQPDDTRSKDTDRDQTSVRFSRELREAAREELREDDVKVDIERVESRIVHPTGQQTHMLREILRHIGTPYRLGGMDASGMDCSAYILKVFNNAMNIDLPRTTVEQFAVGRTVSRANMQFGDLIFFNTTGRNPSHVGIYIGDNLFAHASVSYGVTISSLESTYYQRRITGVRRVLD